VGVAMKEKTLVSKYFIRREGNKLRIITWKVSESAGNAALR
jgi:hypothetical protein